MKTAKLKDSELGPIPEDWEVKRLGEIGEPCMCKRVLKCQTLAHGEVPFYKIGTFGHVPDSFIDRALYESLKSKYSFPKQGDCLISAAGTIGRVVVYNGEDAYFQDSNIVWIDNDESIVANDYLALCYSHMKWQSEDGGIISRLYNANLMSQIILVPPLPEQQRIAEALGAVDRLIDSLDAQIAKKRRIAQGLAHALLGMRNDKNEPIRRLPGFKGEWEKKRLGEIGEFYGGLQGKTAADFGHGNAHYITFLNVLKNVVINTKELAKVEVASSERQNKVRQGDLFFNVSSETPEEVAMCAVLMDELPETYLNSFCCGFRLQCNDNDPLFISYYFNGKMGRDLVKTLANGITRFNLSKKAFRESCVIWPPTLAEQRAIAEVLAAADAEIAALEAKKRKYAQIKAGMMRDLLTGRVRMKGE